MYDLEDPHIHWWIILVLVVVFILANEANRPKQPEPTSNNS